MGTTISFKPDTEIFSVTEFSFEILNKRLREISFLNAGLEIVLDDQRTSHTARYKFEGGIREFVQLLNKGKQVMHADVVCVSDEKDGVDVEIALQWNDSYNEQIFCYTNNVHNRDGGTHLTGLKAALTKTINGYAGERNL